MDDAGDGRRGFRADVSAGLSKAVMEHYGLNLAGALDLGGSANLNLLVDGQWVVRVYRPYVDSTRLGLIHAAREALARAGVPVALPIPSRVGEHCTAFAGRYFEVERFVPNDGRMNSWEKLEAGLPTLGVVHSALAGSSVEVAEGPLFANHVAASEALSWTSKATERIRAWRPTDTEALLAERADDLAQTLLLEADLFTGTQVPSQLVHGDFWDNNVLFAGDQLVLVADFDFMGVRPRIDDLALTLYYANSEFAGDRLSDDRIRQLSSLVKAYDRGLATPLSEAEKYALPLALARQPLWAAGKWLALLDSVAAARRLAAEMLADITWALALAKDPGPWRAAFR